MPLENLDEAETEAAEQFASKRSGSLELRLKFPVFLSESTPIETLHFRPMNGKDMRGLGTKENPFGQTLDLAKSCVLEPGAVIERLAPVDARRVSSLMSFFATS